MYRDHYAWYDRDLTAADRLVDVLNMALFWVVMAGLAYLLLRAWRSIDKKHVAANSSALNILDERFASGDINEEDYLGRRQVLLTVNESAEKPKKS